MSEEKREKCDGPDNLCDTLSLAVELSSDVGQMRRQKRGPHRVMIQNMGTGMMHSEIAFYGRDGRMLRYVEFCPWCGGDVAARRPEPEGVK